MVAKRRKVYKDMFQHVAISRANLAQQLIKKREGGRRKTNDI